MTEARARPLYALFDAFWRSCHSARDGTPNADMIRLSTPTSAQLNLVFAGPNAFSACPASVRHSMRALLDRERQGLAVYEVSAAALVFTEGRPPHGNLYCVLRGCFSLQWENPNGRSDALFTCRQGDLFGELSPGLLDLPFLDFRLQATPIASRQSRVASLLELPRSIVAEFVKNHHFRNELRQTAVRRLCNRVALIPLAHDPALAVAHFCVSPTCGTPLEFHSSLNYLDAAVTVVKVLTFEELARLTGFAINTVRSALKTLEDYGYVRTERDRIDATRVMVRRVEDLVNALDERALTAPRR